ncbi:hypothetical protein BOX15_Mlig034147g1 [Macrostomum lignano]|uniref:C-type lectin domain-containing protein n=2 Tax=Macrostomum lignano TaxID=282301 RepID=A0A267DW75_9PLAT|nr:hypothetical protein BOX15_Mlig034147g1 [Macrostomum lignano]
MQAALLIILTLAFASSNAAASVKPLAQPLKAAVPVKAAAAPPPPPPPQDEVFFGQCSRNKSWVVFRDYCYLYVENRDYWYTANEYCKRQGGYLASITDKAENIFVSKLTYCESVWTGRYAVDVDKLREPDNYRWSDGQTSNSSYHAHNFSRIIGYHQPLISLEDRFWYNNLYHAKQKFVCKVPNLGSGTPAPTPCPTNWKYLNGYCFFMPKFAATYIEADFYCNGRGAHVASLHNDLEVRALILLDLSTDECPVDVWTGLLKLNPCRIDYSTGASVCYRWSDRSGDYRGFPAWQTDNPNNDLVTNCVALNGRKIKSARCHERLRFACKKKA